ncbi:F-box only protein 33 [Frankliniella occidentalis]|uniref:F-box only protein 33 n=1 Tax=Frankliniella occidentalis TaxID=133901 RepID=A0A9C6TXL3_FRAOC|nr:F-box only protein 33 [Frankliniella occidentalis]
MATDGGTWNNLPSVILLEVFKYLPRNDTISASSTCRQWRQNLYHGSLWRNLTFEINSHEEDTASRNRFLTSCFARKLRSAIVKFDSLDPLCVEEAARIVRKLINNPELRKLHLIPSNCRIELPDDERQKQLLERRGIQMLQKVATSLQMEELTLGCMEDITSYSKDLLNLLVENQSSTLRILGLATLKDDPDDYLLPEIDGSLFQNFRHLQILSIDYDNLDDQLLLALNSGQMKRLIVHVHGIADTHQHTSDAAWKTFRIVNPSCELRLTLVHSYDAVGVLHNTILRPSMPLSHLRALFCEQINVLALQKVSMWYANTLRSIYWVDSLQSAGTNTLLDLEEGPFTNPDQIIPNPLIMCAWRCIKLEEIVLLGYKLWETEVLAIFRLRPSLHHFDVWDGDILLDESESLESFQQGLSNEIGTSWEPMNDGNLNEVILNPHNGDSDEYVLPVVINDLMA